MVDHGEVADAGRAQIQGHRRAQPTRAHHQHPAGQNALLPFDPDLIEQDVARVAQQLVVRHGRSVFFLLFLAYSQRFADQDGAALELVECLDQLEILVGAILG